MLRNNQKRAATARLTFLLIAAVGAAVAVMSVIGLASPDFVAGSGLGSALFTVGYGLLLVLEFLLNLASYVVLIRWLRRAYYNLHQVASRRPEYSEGWAAGAWFVPFINLWRPYTIVREVWNDTQRVALGRIVQPDTLLGQWWVAYLLKLAIGRLTFKFASGGDSITPSDMGWFLADAATTATFAVFTWFIIGRAAGFEEQLTVREQIEQLGQPAPAMPAHLALAYEQADYQEQESY